jgi:hypothetical protein
MRLDVHAFLTQPSGIAPAQLETAGEPIYTNGGRQRSVSTGDAEAALYPTRG